MGDDGERASDASPRPGSRRRSWTASALALQRRQSSSDRVNEILENARHRAETMGTDALSPQQSPLFIARQWSSPPRMTTLSDDAADPVDETTGIVSRGTGPNYQAVQNEPRTRARKPMQSNRTPSRTQSGQQQDGQGADGDAASSWWKDTAAKFRSVELENKGSVARDHLALERTFLAWLRTSLAFASIGVAVTQLFRLNTSLTDADSNLDVGGLRHMGRPLGTTFLGASIVTLLLGYKRYIDSQQWIMKGKFPASRGTIAVTAFMAFAIVVLSLVFVIVTHPKPRSQL